MLFMFFVIFVPKCFVMIGCFRFLITYMQLSFVN